MRKLPDWNRICRKIVDGEQERTECRKVLVDELSEYLQPDPQYENPPTFLERVVDGDPAAIAVVLVPVAALVWYLYFYDRGVPQQVVTTS